MTQTIIDSRIILGDTLPEFTDLDMQNEPMFYECSGTFAYKNGGPITRAFLDSISKVCSYADCIIDSRSHLLYPNICPAVPGYHHDAISRPSESTIHNGQDYTGHHVMALINGSVCPTRFALGKCDMPVLVAGKSWNPVITKLINDKLLKLYEVPSNQLIWYHWQTFHEAQVSRSFGWRWFGRAYFDTGIPPRNVISSKPNYYLPEIYIPDYV